MVLCSKLVCLLAELCCCMQGMGCCIAGHCALGCACGCGLIVQTDVCIVLTCCLCGVLSGVSSHMLPGVHS